jgi:hypothetical protein
VLPIDGGEKVCKTFNMSLNRAKEMVADWRGAGRAQGTPDVGGWYRANREKLGLAPATRAYVEDLIELPMEERTSV